MYGEPLGDELVRAIDDDLIFADQDYKKRGRLLADDYGWDLGEARKIWTFGCPPDSVANMIVDTSKGVQFLNEIKDHVIGAFMQVTGGGILCDDVLRGVRLNIDDVTLHSDAIHRGAGQIMPCAKKVFYAIQIASCPRLMEPMYIVDIVVPQQALAGVYATLNSRRGVVEKMEQRIGTPLTQVQAFLPVLESFGFTQLLRQKTGGQAFPQMKFSHWQVMSGDPMSDGSPANIAMLKTRERKGLKIEVPVFQDYYDKI